MLTYIEISPIGDITTYTFEGMRNLRGVYYDITTSTVIESEEGVE
jgi:hypothetical protein